MGFSAKTGKFCFRGSPKHFLDKNAIWDRTTPHLHINCSLHVWGRVQGSKIFKRNSIISIRSKVMAFLVILLSPWSPHHPRRPHVVPVSSSSSPCHPHSPQKVPMWSPWLWSPWSPLLSPWSPHHPRGPHVIPVIPTSSPCHPRHPHIVPIASRRSPCGPHGCGLHGLLCCLHGLHPMLSPWSPWSPHRPCCPHIVPMLSPSYPCHPHSPQKVPMWSPWLWSPWSPLLSPWSPPHVVPVVPTSSPLSPHHPCVIPVIPTSSLSPQIPTPPTPTPLGGGGSQISKNAIRFELIEIF